MRRRSRRTRRRSAIELDRSVRRSRVVELGRRRVRWALRACAHLRRRAVRSRLCARRRSRAISSSARRICGGRQVRRAGQRGAVGREEGRRRPAAHVVARVDVGAAVVVNANRNEVGDRSASMTPASEYEVSSITWHQWHHTAEIESRIGLSSAPRARTLWSPTASTRSRRPGWAAARNENHSSDRSTP